ncbi:helix-turn-helix domain-containing protein [Nonomuraea sp. NPDC005983]|uniref:helix-turn-helix domain-containing protein n=1 Tax=Nonomuraea sp. NPDC005983 TaxID=3155595 RepID=UPI00339E9169
MSNGGNQMSEQDGQLHQMLKECVSAADLAAALRALCRRHEVSLRALAARTHISKSTIGDLLNGIRLPAADQVRAIVTALNEDPQPWVQCRNRIHTAQSDRAAQRSGHPAIAEAQPLADAERTGPAALPPIPAAAADPAAAAESAEPSARRRSPRWRGWQRTVAIAAGTAGAVAIMFGVWSLLHDPTAAALPGRTSSGLSLSTPPADGTALVDPAARPTTAPPGEAGRWSAVHGIGCREEWSYADPGWRPADGGWTKDGCTGTALFMQVGSELGHATQLVNWYFDTRPEARCTIEAFIADDRRSTGTASYYLDDDNTTPPHLAGPVTIDQATHRGSWVTLGTWPVPGPGRLTLILANQPHQANDTHTVTASSARATCRW